MGLLSWFGRAPRCPVDTETREWIDRRWRWLEGQFGAERVRRAPVVLPRPEFFPDRFRGTGADVRRVLDRVCGYMDVDPATVELSLYQDRNPVREGDWKGTAGLYHPEDGHFRIWLEEGNLADPMGMVATLAHELGHVHLLGHGRISDRAANHEPLTDLLTVYFGLGVFTANAVIHEGTWHDGNRSGWSVGRRGYLGMPEFGYALALYARMRGEDGAAWARELRPDVRAAFRQSVEVLAHAEPAPARVDGRPALG